MCRCYSHLVLAGMWEIKTNFVQGVSFYICFKESWWEDPILKTVKVERCLVSGLQLLTLTLATTWKMKTLMQVQVESCLHGYWSVAIKSYVDHTKKTMKTNAGAGGKVHGYIMVCGCHLLHWPQREKKEDFNTRTFTHNPPPPPPPKKGGEGESWAQL